MVAIRRLTLSKTPGRAEAKRVCCPNHVPACIIGKARAIPQGVNLRHRTVDKIVDRRVDLTQRIDASGSNYSKCHKHSSYASPGHQPWRLSRLLASNICVVMAPIGFVVRTKRPSTSYVKLVRFPIGSICAVSRLTLSCRAVVMCPNGSWTAQKLTVGVVRITGSEAQRVDIGRQAALAVVELRRPKAQRVFHRDQPCHRIVDIARSLVVGVDHRRPVARAVPHQARAIPQLVDHRRELIIAVVPVLVRADRDPGPRSERQTLYP